jgi:hypothetical protein
LSRIVFIKLSFEVVPVGTESHGCHDRTQMLPQFRVAAIAREPLEMFVLPAPAFVLGIYFLQFLQDPGGKPIIDNIIRQDPEIARPLRCVVRIVA